MKHLLSVLVLALCLFTACGHESEEGLSTDLVTNPKSASNTSLASDSNSNSNTSEKQAVITFEKTEHDFGNVLQGEMVTYSFRFTNTGNAPLLISQVTSSCGCTVGDFPRQPIEPGQGGEIKATYNSAGHHGFQNRYLTVMSNTMPAKTVLGIKVKVLTPDQY